MTPDQSAQLELQWESLPAKLQSALCDYARFPCVSGNDSYAIGYVRASADYGAINVSMAAYLTTLVMAMQTDADLSDQVLVMAQGSVPVGRRVGACA